MPKVTSGSNDKIHVPSGRDIATPPNPLASEYWDSAWRRLAPILSWCLIFFVFLAHASSAPWWQVEVRDFKMENTTVRLALAAVLKQCAAEHPKTRIPTHVQVVSLNKEDEHVFVELHRLRLLDVLQTLAEQQDYTFNVQGDTVVLRERTFVGTRNQCWMLIQMSSRELRDYFHIDDRLTTENVAAKKRLTDALKIPAPAIASIHYDPDRQTLLVIGQQREVLLLEAAFALWERGYEIPLAK